MACITLTRTALPLGRGASEVPGWTVAYEGRPVAAYAEGADGRLRQVGSSRLDAALGGREGAWDPAREFPDLEPSGRPTCAPPRPGRNGRRAKARLGAGRAGGSDARPVEEEPEADVERVAGPWPQGLRRPVGVRTAARRGATTG